MTIIGTPLAWPIALVAGAALLYAARAFLGYRQVRRDARRDYAYRVDQNLLDPRLEQAGYIRAYERFYTPRHFLYIAIALAAILLLTWPAMGLLGGIYMQLWDMAGRPKIYAPAGIVAQFIIFFSVIFFWALIAFMMARRYHRTKPASFDRELKLELIRQGS